MTTVEERNAFKENPYLKERIYGDFTPFYITIGICAVIGGILIILNIICVCCSKYKHYWEDRNTGNRWLVPLWTVTPHKQFPLDLTELKDIREIQQIRPSEDIEHSEYIPPERPHKLEQERLTSRLQQHQARQQREEYVELQKRESDI